MGVSRSITELISLIMANYREIGETQMKCREYVTKDKYSSAQSCLLHERHLKKKNYNLLQDLKSRINGYILEVRYLADGRLCIAKLTNMTEAEAKSVVELYGKINKLDIEVLEIKKIPTNIL